MHSAATFLTPYVMEMAENFVKGAVKPEPYNDVVRYYHDTTEPDMQDDVSVRIDMFKEFAVIVDTLLARLLFKYIGCTFSELKTDDRGDRYLIHSLFDMALLMDGKKPMPSYMLAKCFQHQKAFDSDQSSKFVTTLSEFSVPFDLYIIICHFISCNNAEIKLGCTQPRIATQ